MKLALRARNYENRLQLSVGVRQLQGNVVGDRSRWAIALFLPVFGVVFFVVRAAWRAYVRTLSESELHLRVFNHATLVAATLWSVIVCLAVAIAWWLAGRLAARDRAAGSDQAV